MPQEWGIKSKRKLENNWTRKSKMKRNWDGNIVFYDLSGFIGLMLKPYVIFVGYAWDHAGVLPPAVVYVEFGTMRMDHTSHSLIRTTCVFSISGYHGPSDTSCLLW